MTGTTVRHSTRRCDGKQVDFRFGEASAGASIAGAGPMIRGVVEVGMNQDQIDRIARMLYRISDSQERDEVTREVANVLAEAQPGFDRKRFYESANVAYLEER